MYISLVRSILISEKLNLKSMSLNLRTSDLRYDLYPEKQAVQLMR
jgi:hypothetical protein